MVVMDAGDPERGAIAAEYLHGRRFQLVEMLGRGSTGVVYRARDCELGREIALKTVATASIPDVVQLKREFRVAADLHHDNLAELHGLYAGEHACFFTMELIRGVDFLAAVRARPEALRPLFAQLLLGVAALHQAGIVHRDLKPSNILVTAADRVVLLDFGLSLRTAPRSSVADGSGEMAGTVLYMAPEQIRGDLPAPAVDLYSVGVLLFEALVGAPPFSGASWQIIDAKWTRRPPSPSTLAPQAAADLATLAEALLDPSPAVRPTAALARSRVLTAQQGRAAQASQAPLFVGRDHELAQLLSGFAALPADAPKVFWVRGESGIGKSALLQRFCESLPTDGDVLVLRGRCHIQESVPFKALDPWIDELAETLMHAPPSLLAEVWPTAPAGLLSMFPALLAVPHIGAATDASLSPAELRQQATAGLRSLLVALARRRRVVVIVDDVQWADLDSSTLLAAALQHPHAPGLQLVLAYRSDDEAAEAVLAPLRTLAGEQLILGPLPDREAVALLTAASVSADGALDLARCVSEGGGNPFLLTTMADMMTEAGESVQPLNLRRLVERRLEQLAPGADELLSLVALAGAPLPRRTVLAASDSKLVGHDATTALVKSKLLRSLGDHELGSLHLFHDRLRASILVRLDAPRQRALHLRLALALEGDPTSRAADLARHFAAAAEAARALPHAERAAGEAMQTLAFERAVELFQLALTSAADEPGHQPRLRRGLADALAAAGRSLAAADAYLLAAAAAPIDAGLGDRQRAAELLIGAGHLGRGRDVLAIVLEHLGLRLPANLPEALVSAAFWRTRLRLRGLGFVTRPVDSSSGDALARVDACWTVASSLGFFDAVRAFGFQTRHLLLSLDLGDPPRLARALAMEAVYVETSGGAARRVAALDRLLDRLGEHLTVPADHAFVLVARGYRQLHTGAFAAAHASFIAAEACYERGAAARWERNLCRTHRLFALVFLGEFAALTRDEPGMHAQFVAADDRASASNLSLLAGPPIALAADRPAAARRRLADGLAMWSGAPPLSFAFLATVGAAQIELYEDDPAAAFASLERAWPDMRPIMMFRSERLLLHALRGHAAAAVLARGRGGRPHRRAVDSALAELRRPGADWALGFASLVDASRHATIRADSVEPLLATAARQFEAADMRAHAGAARFALARRRRDITSTSTAASELATLGIVDPDRWLRTVLPAPERVLGN